ncbi:MAG: hypothetical protein AAGM38_10490 [Pseudomonadota bacterium]
MKDRASIRWAIGLALSGSGVSLMTRADGLEAKMGVGAVLFAIGAALIMRLVLAQREQRRSGPDREARSSADAASQKRQR